MISRKQNAIGLKSKNKAFGKSIGQRKLIRKNRKIKTSKSRKPSLTSRIKRRIATSRIGVSFRKIRLGIKNAYDKIKNIIKTTYKIIKGVVVAVYKTVKFVAKAVYKTAKFMVKTAYKSAKLFVKASYAVGKATVGVVKAGLRFTKRTIQTGGKNIVNAIKYGSLGKVVTKLGWKALKFVGKKIWKGIKKLFFSALKMLGKLFSIGAGFVNTVVFYAAKLGKGIGKGSIWLVKAISGMLVTAFGFAMQMLMIPVNFMKWLATSVFERIHDCLSAIKQGTIRVLRATWSWFKKLLFNKFTIALLIGALFVFIAPYIFKWLGGNLSAIKEKFVNPLLRFAGKVWEFLKSAWEIVQKVGGWIFKGIEWLTNPKGPIAKAIIGIVKTVMWLKKGIKNLIGKSGRANIETFCMFLAGDYIGLALRAAMGVAKRVWSWMKTTKIGKFIINLINAIVGWYIMEGKLVWNVLKIIAHPVKAAMNFGKTLDSLVSPVKEWSNKVAKLWTDNFTCTDIMVEDPIGEGDEVSSNAKIAVRNLTMKGMNSSKVAA